MRAKSDPKYGRRRLPASVRRRREETAMRIAVAISKALVAKRDRLARARCSKPTVCLFPCPACIEAVGPLLTGGPS
jgi:hypothetical protein